MLKTNVAQETLLKWAAEASMVWVPLPTQSLTSLGSWVAHLANASILSICTKKIPAWNQFQKDIKNFLKSSTKKIEKQIDYKIIK